tara:strand:- start:925 stop:1377 length:453 start_codon:yes stop_codon:yes gene_type:complete
MNITIKKVSESDWDFILKIRNQSSSRIAFHDTNIVSKETHRKYMKKLKDSPNAFQWIILYENEPVGYIKIVDSEFGSVLLDGYTRKGIGTNAYNLVFREAKTLGLNKLTATVKITRPTSIEFEKKLGWKIKKIIKKDDIPYSYYIEKILD